LQGEEPCISSIAETKPFGFYIINPGIWRAPDGTPVLFIQFKISATGIDGAAIKKITYVANPLSKAELDCLRAIGRQSHVHLFILNEAQEQLNFFEFQNNFSLTEFADFAERASEGMASHDFTKARSEFLAAHP
jgi:hypothetical protein